MGEKFYSFIAHAKVGADLIVLIPEDQDLNSVDITNNSADKTLLLGIGAPPVEGAEWTQPLEPGGGTYHRMHPPKVAIYAMARAGTCPVRADYTNSSGIDVLKYVAADAYFAKASYEPTTAEREIVATFLSEIRVAGALRNMSMGAILGGPSRALALQDIVRNVAWREVSPGGSEIAFTKYEGFTGNGTDQYINTTYIPSADTNKFAANRHGFGVVVNDATDGANASVMGSYTTGLAPNRESFTAAGARSGKTTNDVLFSGPTSTEDRGGLFAVNRIGAATYRFAHRRRFQDVPTASVTLGGNNYEMLVLAQTTPSGKAVGFSNLTPFFVWAGAPMTDGQTLSIEAAASKMRAAFAVLQAGA
ncbi:hypothetical protein [Methylobacterium bullatum]|uniref:Uncharacterized protein n=1 Tax=Methylobacterium bullatum TaxID=570505 RepID=A0A679JS40_9HYPH|nr:hypothetical protein MBLL_02690 [Methylobacterium bullatum]